jgi:hypothetical protein
MEDRILNFETKGKWGQNWKKTNMKKYEKTKLKGQP